jgi:hypothetical protein
MVEKVSSSYGRCESTTSRLLRTSPMRRGRSGGGRHPGCGRLHHLSRGGVEGGPKRSVARECGRPGEQSSPMGSSRARVERHRGDRLPRGRSAPFVPSGVGHLFTTRGVRVDQVGVNPQWRAVAAVGVAKVNPQGGRDPWPETTRLARPRKGLRVTRRASKPSRERVKLLA